MQKSEHRTLGHEGRETRLFYGVGSLNSWYPIDTDIWNKQEEKERIYFDRAKNLKRDICGPEEGRWVK